jgi:hypothetical protein
MHDVGPKRLRGRNDTRKARRILPTSRKDGGDIDRQAPTKWADAAAYAKIEFRWKAYACTEGFREVYC